MPEDSKKNQNKGAKDQRKPRNRTQSGAIEKKHEKKAEGPKVPVKEPPVYEDPGPEFYKNLNRETDEILKITEEANSKYKKKEIKSNWSKYEMPIESYDEVEEQESMGADYEKLIEATLSVGGHFQFKHEKSWDVETGPTQYDKYFEVNMDNLFLSIHTIPFSERSNVDKSVFSETDILSMNNRATRFKQKYYNDKSYTTPELTTKDNIIRNVKENKSNNQDNESCRVKVDSEDAIFTKETIISKIEDVRIVDENQKHENIIEKIDVKPSNNVKSNVELNLETPKPYKQQPKEDLDNFEELLLEKNVLGHQVQKTAEVPIKKEEDIVLAVEEIKPSEPETPKDPVIESPEDLEKWLDDFLDG